MNGEQFHWRTKILHYEHLDLNLKPGWAVLIAHAPFLPMLMDIITISYLLAAPPFGKCCVEERGLREPLPPSVVLISSPFFFSISVCSCFQGWRSVKCQPFWMYAALLCSFISIHKLFATVHISVHSPIVLPPPFHSAGEMNLHLVSIMQSRVMQNSA